MASAKQPMLVAGREPMGVCRGQDQPRGGSFFMHRRVSTCLQSVSLYDCFPYRLVPPHRDLFDF